jgi:hypothetical protein
MLLNKKIVLITLLILVALFVYVLEVGVLGFPVTHPVGADCIGYKTVKIDYSGITKISCYGIIYNVWLE